MRKPAKAATPSDTDGLRDQFLQPSGWLTSKQRLRPVTADGQPLPWFTYGAIEFLHRIVTPSAKVFEFGAGYSTLWWQERVSLVHSVDSDRAWVDELRPKLAENVVLDLKQADAPAPAESAEIFETYFARPRRTDWPYDRAKVVRRGLDDQGFRGYAAHIQTTGQTYDFIIIDGMARRLCAEFAVRAIAPGGTIILDNSNRSDYDAAFDILGQAGFRQIPFWGLVAGANFMTCTSMFVNSLDSLPGANHVTNSFGLPEY